jgi:hypothetical protein
MPTVFEIYVLKRLDGARQTPFLDSLELHASIRTCEIIGAVAAFGRTVNLKRLNDDDWWRAGAAGFEIAAGGPMAISGFLDNLQATCPYSRRGPQGLQVRFGGIYKWLAFGAEDPAYGPVRAVVGRHIRDNQPLAAGDTIFGSPVVERTLHSIWSLSTESGLQPKGLRKLLRAAGIIGDDQMALPSHLVIFDPGPAEDLVRRIKGAVTLSAAGKYLNAPRVHTHLLDDLDDFLRRLLQGAHSVRKPKVGQATIPIAAKRACRPAAEILRLILDRKLTWVGKAAGRHGYLSVLVNVEEIRAKVRGVEHGGLNLRQVTSLIKTNDLVVGQLATAGYLKTISVRNPVNRCPQLIVKPEELVRFRKKYVSLFALARERGVNFRAVKKALDAAGIEPAFDRKKIAARFYRRSDVALDNNPAP